MSGWDPLLKELLAAAAGTTLLGALIAGLFWIVTGLSPWPILIIGEVGGFGFGVAVLALTSPRRH